MAQPATGPNACADKAALSAIEPIAAIADLTPFRVGDPNDIVATLQALVADGDLVTVYPPGRDHHLSGRLTQLELRAGRLTIETEQTAGALDAADGSVLVVSMPLGIKLQFNVAGSWRHEAGERSLLTADLPVEIVNLQRRRFPRLTAPLGPNYQAAFVLRGEARELSVSDVSLGGVGLRGSVHEGRGLFNGQCLRHVHLALGATDPLVVDLEVRTRRSFRSFLAGEQLHIGCRFVDPASAVTTELRRILEQVS